MIESETVDRLYLQCDRSRTVYVDVYKPLQAHQIDGVRFLFKQYKKKSPGVILNDPPGYGKCVQVALFLRAMRPYLKKPVLILTQTVAVWKVIFEEWTDIGWEVAVLEPQQFSPNHIIFVNSVDDGFTFDRRDWSIVVLHNSDVIDNTKDYLRMQFKTQYQIWITSSDLKDNLRNLARVYEWLHPRQRFNIDAFTTDSEDWKERIQKLIYLDAFLENVILRRSDFANLFLKQFFPPLLTPQLKLTRKNKDPTGTKVKRSRRQVEDEEDNAVDGAMNNVVTTEEPANMLSVEDFIANERPIGSNNDESLIGGNNEESLIGGNDNESIVGGNDNESIVGGNDEESLINGNDDGSVIGSNDEESIVGSNDDESASGSNDDESLINGNNEGSLIEDNDESIVGSNADASVSGSNDEESLINSNESVNGGNDDESLINGNNETSLIEGNDYESIVGDNNDESLISASNDDSSVWDNNEESTIGGNNDESPTRDNEDSMNITVDATGESNLNFSNVFNFMPKFVEGTAEESTVDGSTEDVGRDHDNFDESNVLVPETHHFEEVTEYVKRVVKPESEDSENTQMYKNDTLKLEPDEPDINETDGETTESVNDATDNETTNDGNCNNGIHDSKGNDSKKSFNDAVTTESVNDKTNATTGNETINDKIAKNDCEIKNYKENELKESFDEVNTETVKDEIKETPKVNNDNDKGKETIDKPGNGKEKPDNKELETKEDEVDNELEEKLAAFEEKALKKYKGSFLDRLF